MGTWIKPGTPIQFKEYITGSTLEGTVVLSNMETEEGDPSCVVELLHKGKTVAVQLYQSEGQWLLCDGEAHKLMNIYQNKSTYINGKSRTKA